METMLNKITDTANTTTENATRVQEQINQCIDQEQEISKPD